MGNAVGLIIDYYYLDYKYTGQLVVDGFNIETDFTESDFLSVGWLKDDVNGAYIAKNSMYLQALFSSDGELKQICVLFE